MNIKLTAERFWVVVRVVAHGLLVRMLRWAKELDAGGRPGGWIAC